MTAGSPSLARAQASMGPGAPAFPLLPALVAGCPETSTADVQYPLEVTFDYDAVDPAIFRQPPAPSLDRWAPLLPPLAPGLSMGEGGTPLVVSSSLGDAAGLNAPVYLKLESQNPTFSHKDRLNLATVSAAVLSDAPGIVVASSGNHGVSAAAYASRAGLKAAVIAPPGVSDAFRRMLEAYGADILTAATEERWPLLRRIQAEQGYHPVSNQTDSHTGHPWGPEGYKTIAYEIYGQMGERAPAAVLIPTGYGEMLFGLAKGFLELVRFGLIERPPALYSAEPAAAGPLYRAWNSNRPIAHVTPEPSAMLSIACQVNGYRGVRALRETGGRPLLVTEDAVADMQAKLAREGYWLERSAAAGAAALDQLTPEEAEGGVVAIATSAGFKDP